MKTILNSFWILALLIAGACNNSTPVDLTKTSAVTLRASSQPQKGNMSGRIAGTAAGGVSITLAQVRIADIRIEENSGNDNQQQGDSQNDDGEKDGAENGGSEAESDISSDILLPGPYTVTLTDGLATIANVQVSAGTYKKVNFKFSNDAGDAILITGTYDNGGSSTPFTLRSSFSQTVQLPLGNGGLVVAANSSKDISIVFDINSWFAALDLSSATVTNGEIRIDSSNNTSLLNTFENALLQYIDAED